MVLPILMQLTATLMENAEGTSNPLKDCIYTMLHALAPNEIAVLLTLLVDALSLNSRCGCYSRAADLVHLHVTLATNQSSTDKSNCQIRPQ